MNRRQRFYLNGAILTAVNLALRGVGLFFAAYIARAVGAEGVGLNTLIMTLYAFALTLAGSGISLSVTRLVAAAVAECDREKGVSGVLKGAFVYSSLFGFGSAAAMFLLSDPLASLLLHYPSASLCLKALALSLPPVAYGGIISGYFVGVKRVSRNALVQVFSQLFRVFATVWLVTAMAGRGVAFAVLAISLGTLISEWACLFFSLIVFLIDRRGQSRAKRGKLSPVAKMALPLAVSTYVRSLLLTLEHSLIPKRLVDRGDSSAEALSSYGILHGMALPLILYPMAPLSSFSGLLVPEFAEEEARGNLEKMKKIATAAAERTLAYATVVAVLIFFFSEELGYTVYGSYEAGKFIAFLAPVLPVMYLDHVIDGALKGVGEQVYSMWVNIADACLSVLLVYFLIPLMGITGYAVVIIAMEAFNFILSFLRLRKRIPFSISLKKGMVIPLFSAFGAALLSDMLFIREGSGATVFLFALKLVFSLCLTLVFISAFGIARSRRERKALQEKQ